MSTDQLKIAGRCIGASTKPFIIAEMSGNHNQSLERALAIVDAAADSGACAIKLQTYTADTLTLDIRNGDFLVSDKDSLWHSKSLHELYTEGYTPWEWHESIFNRARERNLICFSSPFDESAVDYLESLSVPAYKIASFENSHLPLVKRVAETGKPLIISTGMASLGELEQTVSTAHNAGCKDLILLKCTSTYPADPTDSNLKTIPHLRELFGCEVGLSDHTPGIGAAVASVALGASVIEKHFTLNRQDGGVDSAFSLEPPELRALVSESERAWKALGGVRYGPTKAEEGSITFRRSIYVSADIRKDDYFSGNNLRIVRPGFGLPPGMLELVIGKRAKRDFKEGEPLTMSSLLDDE